MCADADYDESVTVGDALRALRAAIGSAECHPLASVCDTDGDGSVSASNALLILRSGACRFQSNPGTGLDPSKLVLTTTRAFSDGTPVDPPPHLRIGRIEALPQS